MLKVDLERVEGEKELLSKEDDEVRKKTWIKTVYHSKYLIHAFEENIDSLIEQMWKYNEMGKKEGHLDERKIALIIDDLLDYIAENRDKAIYYEKMCGAEMKFMLLNGHGIRMNIDGALCPGREVLHKEEPVSYVFAPKIDVDSIAIYGQSGTISIPAIRWLVKQGIQVTVLNWDGKLLTTMLPPESVQVKTKFDQYRAYENTALRIQIARKLIEAKFERTRLVLDYLGQRYPNIGTDIERDASKLSDTNTIREVMGVEGAVAQLYWSEFQKIIPDKYEFDGRNIGKTGRPMGAVDTVNCMLNYGYSLLEAECLRAINSTGLTRTSVSSTRCNREAAVSPTTCRSPSGSW